ncbi:MAG TPA: hypothetical protein VK860_03270 [Ilumatobacteraceae bacterium]|nr:hypothetical protein [Ilumatobacteraceae bacterium]
MFLITHHFANTSQEQYDAIISKVHEPDGSLPPGQLHHFAGPTEDGFLVVAVWESKELNDAFQQRLFPVIASMENPPPPPQERTARVTNAVVG